MSSARSGLGGVSGTIVCFSAPFMAFRPSYSCLRRSTAIGAFTGASNVGAALVADGTAALMAVSAVAFGTAAFGTLKKFVSVADHLADVGRRELLESRCGDEQLRDLGRPGCCGEADRGAFEKGAPEVRVQRAHAYQVRPRGEVLAQLLRRMLSPVRAQPRADALPILHRVEDELHVGLEQLRRRDRRACSARLPEELANRRHVLGVLRRPAAPDLEERRVAHSRSRGIELFPESALYGFDDRLEGRKAVQGGVVQIEVEALSGRQTDVVERDRRHGGTQRVQFCLVHFVPAD